MPSKSTALKIVLDDRMHVNHEVPQATGKLSGFYCKHLIGNPRSFYARQSILEIIEKA
jgi:hypothetical protein